MAGANCYRERRRRFYEVSKSKRKEFSTRLVAWYDENRRPFPWRHSSDPYYVTVCEVLLQRTNAEKVAMAVRELFQRFPEPDDLAGASAAAVAQVLRPLGLPHRVRQVRQIAITFARSRADKRLVGSEELSGLPGVGPYVLAAVRVLALGEREALIDEHVLRVLRRVFSICAPARRHPTKALREFCFSLVPADAPKQYNLAILDLGRLVCRPTNPRHGECPVESICDYAKSGGGGVGRAA